jgi:hypothetical protein
MRHELALATFIAAGLAAPLAANAQSYNNQGYVYGAPQGAPVDPACAQSARNNAMIGGGIGALLGAAAGRSVAARNARDEGAIAGAVAGAVLGSQIGQRRVVCPTGPISGVRNQSYEPAVWQPAPAPAPVYRTSTRPTRVATVTRTEPVCRWGETVTRDPDGYELRSPVRMCLGADGVWRAQ